MIRAAVIGATGYAGAETVRILAGHPGVSLSALTSRQHAGKPFREIYPSLTGHVDLTCETFDLERICAAADVVFTALPHKLPMDIAPGLLQNGKKVVDLSADFRFRSRETYERHYQPHAAPELLSRSVYGLAEIYRDEVRGADLVGNPGCYPTCALLPLIPLVQSGLIDPRSVVCDAKSGVSGAGRSPAVGTLFAEVSESFKAYNATVHRHNPEIDEVLSRAAGATVHATFVPHLLPMSRGMLVTAYAALSGDATARRIGACLADCYADAPFIRLCGADRLPETRHVRSTNYCDIGFRVDEDAGRAVLISAIDNLVKGAAGQAVQNMNLMMGLPETAGLDSGPAPV
jgi:N-acetyl-gamma-glutamyl-phosphate reductase